MLKYSNLPKKRSDQQGAVLVVSLVILLVMTVVGVSSMMSSTLQERMAGNSRQRTLARFAAEAALKSAEAYLGATVVSTSKLSLFNGADGLYSDYQFIGRINTTVPLSGTLADVTDPDSWTSGNSVEVAGLSSSVTAANPRYIIEYVGRDKGTANKVVLDPNDTTPTTYPHIFRIVAIGWGQDSEFYSVLQSTYRTGYGPGIFTY